MVNDHLSVLEGLFTRVRSAGNLQNWKSVEVSEKRWPKGAKEVGSGGSGLALVSLPRWGSCVGWLLAMARPW